MNNCDLWKRVQEYVLQIYLTIKIESSSVCNVCIFFVSFFSSFRCSGIISGQIFISFRVSVLHLFFMKMFKQKIFPAMFVITFGTARIFKYRQMMNQIILRTTSCVVPFERFISDNILIAPIITM